MADGIPYVEVFAIIARNGGSITVNPLARHGSSRIWKACQRARKHGLVHIKHEGAGRAVVTRPRRDHRGKDQ